MKYYRTEKQRLYYDKVIALYRDKHMGKTRISKNYSCFRLDNFKLDS